MNLLIMRSTFIQLLRYGIIGVLSNAVGYLLYLAITAAGLEHKLTMTLLYVIGVAQTFIFNKRWTFRHNGMYRPVLIRYCISYAFGYAVNLLALYMLVDCLGYPHQIVQGMMIVALAAMLFLLQKFWVFSANLSLSTTGTTHL